MANSNPKARAASKLGTQFPELFKALSEPFGDDEVKELPRKGPDGKPIKYVTARTMMNRLDTVLGNERWTEEYLQSENSVICRLTITLPNGETLTKSDAGGFAGMKDQDNNIKSGFSDAFKRACYKLGVARYLYRDGIPYYDADVARYESEDSQRVPESHAGKEVGEPQPVHRGALQSEKTEEPQPATLGTPAKSEGHAVGPDSNEWDESFWVYLSDEVARKNVAFQEDHDEEQEPCTNHDAVMKLVWITWEAGLHPMSPSENPTAPLGQWVQVLEKIAKTSPKHRQRLEKRLQEHLTEVYNQAALEKKPTSTRGAR